MVICTATNELGTNECMFTVTVRDVEPPVITCQPDFFVPIPAGETNAGIGFPATATDNCQIISTNCVPPSGSSFNIGTNTVVCKAVDASGNTNTCFCRGEVMAHEDVCPTTNRR